MDLGDRTADFRGAVKLGLSGTADGRCVDRPAGPWLSRWSWAGDPAKILESSLSGSGS